MKYVLLSAILLITHVARITAQVITVTSEQSGRPVSEAVITDSSGNIITATDKYGKATLPAVNERREICIRHFAFERVCVLAEGKDDLTIQLKDKVFDISEFVISANRWEENRNEVPNRIMSVQTQEIRFRNPQTSADLLGITNEVFIQKSQLGGGSPMIRGFAANRLLIVIDGVRMNNAIYREGNIQNVISLDPNIIESSEVIFGPGAFVYGSDAIGGVMDFHTSEPILSGAAKSLIKWDAFTRYSSANNEKTIHGNVNLGTKKVALTGGITWSDFGDLRMGKGKYDEYLRTEYVKRINSKDSVFENPDPRLQVGSGYQQLNTTLRIKYRISDKTEIMYSNHYSRLSDVPRYDRLIQYKSGKLRYAEWYYGPQIWSMNSLSLKIKNAARLFDEMKIIASYQGYTESRHDRSFGKLTRNNQMEKLKIGTLNIDLDKKLNEATKVFYGTELFYNDIVSEATSENIETAVFSPAGSRYPNGSNSYSAYAAYAGLHYQPWEKVTVSSGVRYNFVTLKSEIADNSFYNLPFSTINISNGALTGSVGLVYKPSVKSQLNFNLSTGFRAPNLDDAGKVFESAPGIVVVPNAGLKPEYAYNADIGFSHKIGETVRFEIACFYTWLKDAMVRHDFLFNGEDSILYQGELSKVEAIVNAGYARVYGISSAVEVNILKHLSFKSSFNLTEGEEKGGIPLRHAAPIFGSVHLLYKKPSLMADLYVEYNGARIFDKMPPSEISKAYLYAADSDGNPWSPGWVTLNFRFSADLIKTITVNAGVENILNKQYRPYSSGIVSPGRNIVISARFRF